MRSARRPLRRAEGEAALTALAPAGKWHRLLSAPCCQPRFTCLYVRADSMLTAADPLGLPLVFGGKPGGLDDRAPALEVFLHYRGEADRRHRHRLHAHLDEAALRVAEGARIGDAVGEALDDLRRRLRRREKAEPGIDDDVGEA